MKAREIVDKLLSEEMNRTSALKVDKDFYVDEDPDGGPYCVFGDNSGFCYASPSTKEKANEIAKDLKATRKK